MIVSYWISITNYSVSILTSLIFSFYSRIPVTWFVHYCFLIQDLSFHFYLFLIIHFQGLEVCIYIRIKTAKTPSHPHKNIFPRIEFIQNIPMRCLYFKNYLHFHCLVFNIWLMLNKCWLTEIYPFCAVK